MRVGRDKPASTALFKSKNEKFMLMSVHVKARIKNKAGKDGHTIGQ